VPRKIKPLLNAARLVFLQSLPLVRDKRAHFKDLVGLRSNYHSHGKCTFQFHPLFVHERQLLDGRNAITFLEFFD
jgi:hypothetical protein